MTKASDLTSARAALKAADDAMIAPLVADLVALQDKAAAVTAETPAGDATILTIRNHLNHLRVTLAKSHGISAS